MFCFVFFWPIFIACIPIIWQSPDTCLERCMSAQIGSERSYLETNSKLLPAAVLLKINVLIDALRAQQIK